MMRKVKDKLYLFIDTNIYLGFYHFSNNDLNELEKLVDLLKQRKIILIFPYMVYDEFFRQRDNTLADSLKTFRSHKIKHPFPRYATQFNEYEKLINIQKKYSKVKDTLLKKIIDEIDKGNLIADKLIKSIHELSYKVVISEKYIKKSHERMLMGNPPGKNNSIGDAINWLILLDSVPKEEELYFISQDGDFSSKLKSDKFNSFLLDEWKTKKGSNLIFYTSLNQFFNDKYKDIKLVSEHEKDFLIKELHKSRSFFESRDLLYKINKFDNFDTHQVKTYINAAMGNNQIYWISKDSDINELLYKFVYKNMELIPDDLLTTFKSYIPEIPKLPF